MKTLPVLSKATITIPAKQEVKYLFNHVCEFVKEEQVTSVFAKDCISIKPETSKQTDSKLS